MKLCLFHQGSKQRRGGFSLVEATFSIGLMSFGFLTMAPLLGLGLKTARLARDDRATAQIAQTLIEEAEQGTLPSGTVYLDIQGTPLNSANNSSSTAVYTVQSKSVPVAGSNGLTQMTLQIIPSGAPDRMRTYAVVFQTPPAAAP